MSFMQPSPVKYACSCGVLNPINKLFFCRHCPKLRCGLCVCHEIESHFCSNCLENIPSTEARHRKNCCANCFECPCCQHTLSARATTVPVVRKTEEPKDTKEGESVGGAAAAPAAPASSKPSAVPTTKKMYYLSCLSCRWTTRDVGIPDQGVATGTWPDNECLYQARFNTLVEYFQAVVLQDKQEKMDFLRRKAPKQPKFPSLTDRTGLTVSMIRRQIGWTEKTLPKPRPVITPAEATSEVEELPAEIFTEPLNLRNVTTIAQRHSQPAEQPTSVSKLYPQRRSLWIKRSLRCRQCEHNLIKPEYHPTSIKYRIQLFASCHVPEVVMVRCEQPLVAGKSNAILLKFTNPTMYDMTISLLTDAPSEEGEFNAENQGPKEEQDTATPVIKGVNLARQNSTREVTREVKDISNAPIVPLESEFVLSQRDDSKEFDEYVQLPTEEPKFIVWRKGNKVLIRLQFTPSEELSPNTDVVLGFFMQYTYVNTVTNASEKKEPTTHALHSRVFITAGTTEQKAN
ncbi:uncharacterized protein Dana_GF11704 [Drosophila ananassae]|uniref:Dynactin subunit 4 n=1 Tax=Drosophila ananassae TaxID=7217 RepID=B3MHS5_DROAN|nr:dynactin subunit 4 [Drosophila ananassae]EDV36912.1 uncharacterized protein Dana_GF11704 [Drosophila ananassae]